MSKKARLNPLAEPMFEILADAMLLEDSRKNAAILGALDGMRESWPEEDGPAPEWDSAIVAAYERHSIPLLRKVLDNRREAGLAVCRNLGIEVE